MRGIGTKAKFLQYPLVRGSGTKSKFLQVPHVRGNGTKAKYLQVPHVRVSGTKAKYLYVPSSVVVVRMRNIYKSHTAWNWYEGEIFKIPKRA